MKEIQPDHLLEDPAEDVSPQCREKLMEKKFVGENLAGNFWLHAILVELSKSVIPSY